MKTTRQIANEQQQNPTKWDATPLPSVEEVVPKEITHTYTKVKMLLNQDRNQAYTRLVEGIAGMKSDPTLPVDDALYSRSDIDREVDKTLTDILENVVKPLYRKE